MAVPPAVGAGWDLVDRKHPTDVAQTMYPSSVSLGSTASTGDEATSIRFRPPADHSGSLGASLAA